MCSDWLIAQQPNHCESRECHNQCILTNRPSHISTEMSRSTAFRNSEKIGSSGFAGVFAIAWDHERCQSLGNLRVSTASTSTAIHFLFFDPALGTQWHEPSSANWPFAAIAASARAQFRIFWSTGSLLSDSGGTYVLDLFASTNRSLKFFILLNSFVSS
jgi:hypothetical protein